MPYQLLSRSGLRLRSAARNLWIGRNAAERKSATDHCPALGQDRNGSARTAPEFLPGAICRGLQNEFDQFVGVLENGSPMPTTAHDGRQALRLADCALESALTGRAVKV